MTDNRTKFFALGTALLLSLGASATAFAQEQTPPSSDVRAQEVPADVRGKQLRSQGMMPAPMQGRSESRGEHIAPPAATTDTGR